LDKTPYTLQNICCCFSLLPCKVLMVHTTVP
jgi:hypothetical protein